MLLPWLVLCIAWPGPARANGGPAPDDGLSAEERAWLDEHPVVRIGVDPAHEPDAFTDAQGRFQGMSSEVMARLAAITGLRFELVRLPDWAAVREAAQARRIDLYTPLVVMTREQRPRRAGAEALGGMKVARVRGFPSSDQVLARHPGIAHGFVKDPLAGLAAVAEGSADACVGVPDVNLHLVRQHGLRDLRVNTGFDRRDSGQRLAVRKDWAPLARILDKALGRIPQAEQMAMLDRWLRPLPSTAQAARPTWTAAEQLWLDRQALLCIGVEWQQAPFSVVEVGGQPDGLVVRMVEQVLQPAGMDDVLAKPVDPPLLLATWRRVLQARAAPPR